MHFSALALINFIIFKLRCIRLQDPEPSSHLSGGMQILLYFVISSMHHKFPKTDLCVLHYGPIYGFLCFLRSPRSRNLLRVHFRFEFIEPVDGRRLKELNSAILAMSSV